jgi:hypothetical protein
MAFSLFSPLIPSQHRTKEEGGQSLVFVVLSRLHRRPMRSAATVRFLLKEKQ